MVKKRNTFLKAAVLLIAPTVFFLSLAFVVITLVLGVRSINDIVDLKYVILVPTSLATVSLVAIRATGISTKKVLVGWLENNLDWLFP